MNKRKVLVLGASAKEERYSNKAIRSLLNNGFSVVAMGNKEGETHGVKIHKKISDVKNEIATDELDTLTLYLGPNNQSELPSVIRELKPKRVIFNPGTENSDLYDLLESAKIPFEEACTLVLLNINEF